MLTSADSGFFEEYKHYDIYRVMDSTVYDYDEKNIICNVCLPWNKRYEIYIDIWPEEIKYLDKTNFSWKFIGVDKRDPYNEVWQCLLCSKYIIFQYLSDSLNKLLLHYKTRKIHSGHLCNTRL